MTSDDINKLKSLVLEYCSSMAKIDDQRYIMSAIAARVMPEVGVEPADFKAIARAYHKDAMRATRDKVSSQAELFDVMIEETTL